jgi:Domain of unknown function (DUF4249)
MSINKNLDTRIIHRQITFLTFKEKIEPMKNSIKFILLITSVIFNLSCEKIVTVKAVPYENQLSIECLLESGQVPKLYLNKSVAYFNDQISSKDLFISNASVKISTGDQTDILSPSSESNEFLCQNEYFYLGKNIVEFGKTYTLEVNFQGKKYTAETTVNQKKPTLKSIGFTPKFNDLYGEHEGVIFTFDDIAGQENFYRYQMDRLVDSTVRTANNKKYRSDCNGVNLFKVVEVGRSIYSDKNTDGLSVNFTIEPSYTHKAGSKAKVYIQSIDKKAAEFFEVLDRQKLSSYNPFVEPVFLKTQIPGCIGVFGNINVSEPLDFVYPE